MLKDRKSKLAASFVVTVSAMTGCRKQTIDNDPVSHGQESVYVGRYGDHCTMGVPEHCPKGASCNPPPPPEIDCPASLRDAGEPEGPTARPPGKEDWLRVKPRLWASQNGCSFQPEYFCAPPPKAYECTPQTEGPPLKCTPVALPDGGPSTRTAIAAFVYKDGTGACRKVPAFECNNVTCLKEMPASEAVPCP